MRAWVRANSGRTLLFLVVALDSGVPPFLHFGVRP